jgi:hypothetical protein
MPWHGGAPAEQRSPALTQLLREELLVTTEHGPAITVPVFRTWIQAST